MSENLLKCSVILLMSMIGTIAFGLIIYFFGSATHNSLDRQKASCMTSYDLFSESCKSILTLDEQKEYIHRRNTINVYRNRQIRLQFLEQEIAFLKLKEEYKFLVEKYKRITN